MSTKTLIRGGQIFLHNLRMLKQIAGKLFFAAWALLSVLFFLCFMGWETPNFDTYRVVTYYNAAFQRAILGGQTQIIVHNAEHQHRAVSAQAILSDPAVIEAKKTFFEHIKLTFPFSLFFGCLGALAFITLVLTRYGKNQTDEKKIRGNECVDNRAFKKRLIRVKKASDLTLANLPLLQGAEWGHFLFHGTTGSGKSTGINDLLSQIRDRCEPNILYDKSGDYVRRFYRPGYDVILNPLDARSPAWDLWRECQAMYDFDDLAKTIIPMPPGVDPFWVNGARMILAASSWKMREDEHPSLTDLLKHLLISDLSEAATLLRDTEAASLVSEKIEKTAVSIKAVLATYLKCLRYVCDDGEKFSIRQWIQSENNDRWLFITSGGRQHEAIKPLITLWLNLAGTALLDLVPNYQRRIWMTLDELPSLHQLPFLLSQLAEVRKFGGCMILGVQNIAHLRSVYGTHDAQTIADLCNTRLFLRSNDADVARWVSTQLGEADIEEMRESISYGANTLRDGVSLQRQRSVRPIVMGCL